jgi:uracil phosphoribosyltransferase
MQKLPKQVTVDTLFLLDPLVATGGTAIAAISILVRLPFSLFLFSFLFLPPPVYLDTDTFVPLSSSLPQLDWGLDISQIKLVSVLGSKPGLDKVQEAYPGLDLFVAGVDAEVRFAFFRRRFSAFPRQDGKADQSAS